VTAGDVHAVIPRRWATGPVTGDLLAERGLLRRGVVISPNPRAWKRRDGSVPGLEAMWLDKPRGGIPSDYYYLAATGPATPSVLSSDRCRPSHLQVIVDHKPALTGKKESPGDYAARASGTCGMGPHSTRWAYFVAAPGFGPVKNVGIPRSGLYFVFAVLHDGPQAQKTLHRMLSSARFGRTSVSGLTAAARRSGQLR
jgi:hypothetical protein